jgi:hypothetical protein
VQFAGTVVNVLSKLQDANSKLTKPVSVFTDFFLQKMIAVGTWQLLTIEDFHCTNGQPTWTPMQAITVLIDDAN